MEGMKDHAIKSGLAYDYLQKVSYYTNWDYVYVYGDWDAMLQKLYRGEIDLMAGVSKTPEREANVLFPDYPMGLENYYIYVYSDSPLASKGIGGLRDRTVSVNTNTVMEDMLREWNSEGKHGIVVTTYSGTEGRLKDFDARRTDATVDTDNAVGREDNMVPIAKIGQSEYYLVINHKRPDLLQELNTAIGKMTSTDPYFTKKLANAYFSDLAVSGQLQEDELAWINNHPTIVVGYLDDYLPFSDTGEDGHVQGIITDLLNEITAKLKIKDNVKFSFVSHSSYESLIASLQAGSIDIAFPVNNDVARAEQSDIFLTSEVISTPMYLAYKGDFSQLTLRRMAAKRGNSIADIYIRNHFPDVEVIYYDKIGGMLDAVKNGDVDGCILNQFRKDGFLIHPSYNMLKTATMKDYSSRCFAVKRGNNELLSILNRGITALPSDFGFTSTYVYTSKMTTITFKDYILQNFIFFMIVTSIIISIVSGLLAYIYMIHRNREKMEYIAHHDGLTGLLNRRSFNEDMETLNDELAGSDVIVLAMDLNGLKTANDNLGHEAGDELITGAAGCMTKILAPYGNVYRVGGDEFMAILFNNVEDWPNILQRLKDSFEAWNGKLVKTLSVAIGSSSSRDYPALNLNDMVSSADQEMYKDKAAYYKRNGIDRRKNR
ncbi:diguanylate cyclase/phosphodiesterase [Anaerovibrio sp. JC8]|uniref:transporter substrate-binding domain-containing diguanylate cyclase n=1 Tax=Anaerovibrio sp. JC8 TaxID=1240085 RepID=UPI000A0E7CB7|nr:transporter substrate-binding domain-containing protein [Anaerovibrio sp. JC8]ORT99328.1 diguanylate cyclase/phosphodiesterase [Anaerovibrio sp. JC8]